MHGRKKETWEPRGAQSVIGAETASGSGIREQDRTARMETQS